MRPILSPADRRQIALLALAAVVGVGGATAHLAFHWAVLGASGAFRLAFGDLGRIAIVPSLLAGGAVLLVLDRVFPGEVLGYGFPRFLEMIHLQSARVKRRWIFVKTLGTAVSLGAGASVGREGPLAQIGGAVGGTIAWLARLPAEQRKTLVACGAAATIATTFDAPIGGLMFAYEIVLLGEAQLSHFVLVVVATATAVSVARGLFGVAPVFHTVPFDLHYADVPTYAVLGVVLGVLAALYVRLFHAVAARVRAFEASTAAKLCGGLVLLGLLDVAVPGNVGDGYPLIDDALAGRLDWRATTSLALAKVLGSSLALGCGAPGGVFGPILFIGAMTGASVHALSAVVVPAWTGPAGSYALVGLGAFLAGATHAPLTAVFLVFEMTRNYAVVVPALMASSIALLVATRLEPESIDTLGLSAEGKSLHPATDAALLARVPVEAVCRRGVPVISDAATVRETVTAIGEARGTVFPVADAGGRFVGLLPLARLHDALLNDEMRAGGVARDLCDPHGATLPAGTSLADALRLMEADAVDELAVILPGEPPRYVGMLSRADLLAAGNRAVLAATSPLMTDWLSVATAEPATGAYRVATVPAPVGWIGRTLRDLDTRRRFGVVVLAVNPDRKTAGYELPDPDRPFAKADRVVLAGTEDSLRRAREVSA